jgi:hypothetical protein
VEGPGLVFTGPHPGSQTKFDERVLGVADLRPQIRLAKDIHGYTRDGIEVTSHIYTLFTLGQPADTLRVSYVGEHLSKNLRVIYLDDKVFTNPEDGKPVSKVTIVKDLVDELDPVDKDEIHRIVHSSEIILESGSKVSKANGQPAGAPFYYDPKRVFAAIAAEAQDVDRGEPSDWTELPARVATEVFRNMLAREVYDVLYMPSKPDEYPIQDFKSNFALRVRNLGVLNFQYVERVYGGEFKKGQEWDEENLIVHPTRPFRQPKVLRARGIKVITAGFTELKPVNPGIYQQRLDNWRARWEREEVAKRVPYDFEALRIRDEARIQGQRDLAQALARILKQAPYTHDDLALRVFQALQTAAANPATRKLLPDSTIHLMGVLGDWLIE